MNKDWRPTAFVDTAPGVVTEQDAVAFAVAIGALAWVFFANASH